MNTKFTPGPWIASHAGTFKSGVFEIDEFYVTVDGADVAIAADITDPYTGQKSEENARLIAAAPALLSALACLLEAVENLGHAEGGLDGLDHLCAMTGPAYSAIKQATGK